MFATCSRLVTDGTLYGSFDYTSKFIEGVNRYKTNFYVFKKIVEWISNYFLLCLFECSNKKLISIEDQYKT